MKILGHATRKFNRHIIFSNHEAIASSFFIFLNIFLTVTKGVSCHDVRSLVKLVLLQ